MRLARAGAALFLVPGAATARAQEAPPPPIIDTVVIRTHNVFGAADARNNFLFRLANALHVPTRPGVVRNELLFRAGEPYDSARVAETARNLRRRGLFRHVAIDTVRVDGRLHAVVETADGWTTELVLNARSTGGELSWAAGVQERNFLGTGARVGATYRDEPDRTAVTLAAGIDRVAGTRFRAAGAYDDLSDGTVGVWHTGVPFAAFGDRWAVTLSGEAATQRVLRYRVATAASVDTSRFERRALVNRLTTALAPRAGTGGYMRVGLELQLKREEFVREADTALAVPDSVSAAIGAFVELVAARFRVVTHYDGFAREEDLDLSTRLTLGAWAAPAAFGYAAGGVGPALRFEAGAGLGLTFVKLEAGANALVTDAGLDSGRVRAALTLATQAIPRNATVLHVEVGARRGAPPGAEFDLGHGLGPRAFGPHAFVGDRMIWGSLEQRAFLVDEVLGLMGVGFAAFVDYGGAWYEDQPRRLGGDVGLGLRIGATRATGQNVGRFDLAYRFGEGFTGRRWVVSFGRGFAF